MQISVKGRHLSVGEPLREKIEDRLRAAVDKYFSSAIDAHVVFAKTNRFIQTDVTIHVGHGITLQSHAQLEDMTASFEAAADKLEKRLRRHKRRLRNHRKDHTARDQTITSADQYVLAGELDKETDAPDDDAPQSDAPVIVAETKTDIDVLSVGDAVMHMDLAQSTVLMFRNARHGGLNVVYRRTDGNIGWIDPKDSSAPR